nr:hypothetical protein [Bacteroidota bacterium]
RYMMEKIRQSGEVKLTDKGFLPTAVVKDIHSQGFIKEYFLDEYKKGKVIREFDSYAVHMTRMLLEATGLIKKRKGKLSLTKKGEKLFSQPGLLLFHLLHTYCFSFNLAFFDGYGQNNIVRIGWAFTIILLSKYGRHERPNTFYAEKHFHAFPAMIHEVENTYKHDQQRIAYNCYSHRMIEHFMQHLGVIDIKYERYFDEVRNISATDLLWKLFQVQAPYAARRWN